jgi:hypothetical protein
MILLTETQYGVGVDKICGGRISPQEDKRCYAKKLVEVWELYARAVIFDSLELKISMIVIKP